MHKSKTHFEQIPVELVKKIAKKDVPDDKDGNDGAETTIRTSKLKPHRLPSLGKTERGSNHATLKRNENGRRYSIRRMARALPTSSA
jgi:hypothetical protein